MANNRIGCSSGKTKLIDPNNFYGQDSSNNMSVPLEDLTISVQLSTSKKGRTILSSKGNVNTTQNSDDVRVTFIEGTVIDGQKVLTTKFTDLTTVFDKDNDSSENLGITNIDVDFNSSYAPLITINFIDLRGSSIFQNESQLNNNQNKYSVFFQLPYPLYELTIKGYYGKPVKYCLHMTKFNSKFNAQTGNFEITANFIGYTYAMLSDMLLGILKAIPYTTKGKTKYGTLKDEDPSVLNLNELMIKISQIDSNLSKIGSDDPDAAKLTTVTSMLDDIEAMKQNINLLGQTIDYKSDLSGDEAYSYIAIADNTAEATQKKDGGKKSYNELMTERINQYNVKNNDSGAGQRLNLTDFLTDNATTTLTNSIQIIYAQEFSNPNDTTNAIIDRKSLVGSDKINVYNMKPLFSELNKKRVGLEIKKKNIQLKLGQTIKNSITKSLSFEPTIRNIVNTFTIAVEVFLAVIYEVSSEAEVNAERETQLKTAFKVNGNSDLKTPILKFYPWPDYRSDDAHQGYVEKYLGSPGVLQNPKVVDELLFIDDLYNAFLTAKRVSDEALLEQQQNGATWLPVNPFDTKIYNSRQPYDRLSESSNQNDIINLILIRMMTFMGYTQQELIITPKVIETMAKAEANAIIRSKKLNNLAKQALQSTFNSITPSNIDPVINTTGKINTKNVNVLVDSALVSGHYTYNYILTDSSDHIRVLPLSDGFSDAYGTNETWSYSLKTLQDKYADDNSVFLTNYTRDTSDLKKLDGGRYIDIITLSRYDSVTNGVIDPIDPTPIEKMTLDKTTKKITGYSIFNGPYGIQEFKTMDYGSPNLTDAPLKYLFYAENNIFETDSPMFYGNTTLSNFVSYGRNNRVLTSSYDITNNKPASYKPINYVSDYELHGLKFGDSINIALHSNKSDDIIKNNRYVLTLDKENLSYPYVELLLDVAKTGVEEVRLSLFGSKLYYAQSGSTAEFNKAFLFLNTLPFNGKPFTELNKEGYELNQLFNVTGGFIHAPRLWCAWVGSLIWRSGLNLDNRNFGKSDSNWVDPIFYPKTNSGDNYYYAIGRYEYFRNGLMLDVLTNKNAITYSEFLKSLPQQVIESFYDEFYRFVTLDNDEFTNWKSIKYELEIINIKIGTTDETDYEQTYNTFRNIVNGVYSDTFPSTTPKGDKDFIDKSFFNSLNINNYIIVTPIPHFSSNRRSVLHNDGLFLELRGTYKDNDGIRNIINALTDEVVIVNSGYGAYNPLTPSFGDNRQNIVVLKDFVKAYLNQMQLVFKDYAGTEEEIKKQNKQDVFGTDSDEIVKLQLYRTCKNVYDKWVGNAPDGNNVVFQCGGGTVRHDTDSKIAIKRGVSTPKLIDSFRFVTRSFRDIGDDFFVDPRPVGTYLTDNPNSSFYDAVTNLLSSNNFDFIPLPSFINYNDKQTLESIFDTYTYEESVKDGICGPSFVCVYVGQKSKHLDFNGSEYENDGFDIQCDGEGGMMNTLPKDFTNNSKDYENDVAVFKVAYSQQNQNIFKDIILDQSEFTETEESLKIIDDISKTGSENQRHFGGQNLYSVYGVRSYKTEVEMMGNAMIQPMMYFQLDNIPMFHGAYMITHVKHSIQPNSMSTNFTGVRIRHPETPILDAAELYMSLLENIEITATNTSASAQRTKTVNELSALISTATFNANKDIKYTQYTS